MSATAATSGKSKTAGKVAPSRPPSHVSAANQHSNGTVMTKPNTSANLVKSGNSSAKPVVQPKLTVGKPNDSFEQQADAMAQKVVEMTPADVRQLSQSKHPPKQPNSASEKKSPRSPLQKKDQPGSFMLQASVEKEKVSKKEDEKIKKKEDEKLKKKADEKILKAPEKKIQPIAEVENEKKKGAEEKVQKKSEPEKIQKAPAILTSAEKLLAKLFPVQPKPVQLKEEEKLQKTEELKKKADEKIQKKSEPEKIQKAPEQKVLPKETVQPKPVAVQAKPVQLKEEEKLRKVEEKKKTEEKVQKKAEPEKIQKAFDPKIQSSSEKIQPKPFVIQAKALQLKEEEKLRKMETEKKKNPDEKIQKKADEKIQKAPEQKIQPSADKLQAKPIAIQTKPLQLKEEEKLRKIETEKKTEEKVQKKTEDKLQKADNTIQPEIQKLSFASVSASLQKKEDEKIQKASEEKVMKAGEKKEEDKIHKAGEEKIMKAAEKKEEPKVQKAEEEKVMKSAEGNENELSPEFESRLQGTMAGGLPMDRNLLGYMESRFDVDFSAVRFHNDQQSAQLCNEIGAQAFAYKNHVYFNRGKYNPDSDKGRFLIAHELTHVIQQGYATAKGEGETKPPAPSVTKAEEKLQSSPQNISPSSPRVQRLGLSDILDGLAALAANIPGFTLLTVILGRNPINMQSVDRSPLNILHGFIGLIPGGEILFQILSQYNVAQRIASWIGQQVEAMGINFSSLRDAFTRFTDSLSWSDIFSPGDVWRRAKDIFTPFITRIINFVAQLITQAIAWLKETFMQPLSDFCREIPGYTLVTVLLGRDPFTNAAVPRTAMNVVKAFAEFIPGGTEKVKELEESKALEKAYAWFIAETQSRNLTWDRVAGTFTTAWESLKLEDVLSPIATLARIGAMFRPLMSDLIGFAVAALIKLLEFIYEAVMGAGGSRVLAIIKKSQATFLTVIKNPVGFLSNLVTAVGMGIRQFAGNILVHLQTGVISWLTGTLSKAGVELPAKWDLMGILKFIMGLLGITWPRIRAIAVEVFGATVVDTVEKVAGIVMDIKEKGFVQTIKDRINEYFSGLKEMILGKIKSFIQERIVMAGIAQLVSLLSPVGAVIQAIIKTYQTVMFFIQKINQILDFVESIVDSIAAIAAGSLGAAAGRVEQTMARTIPLILDFLARMIGLGDVSGKIKSLIEQAQTFIAGKIRQAMMWAKAQVMKLVTMGTPKDPAERLKKGMDAAKGVMSRFSGKKVGEKIIKPLLGLIKMRYQMQRLDAVLKGKKWVIMGEVNPKDEWESASEEEVEAGDEIFTILTSPSGSIKILYDTDSGKKEAEIPESGRLQTVMAAFDIPAALAIKLLQKLPKKPREIVSFARNEGDPVVFLKDILQNGRMAMSGVDKMLTVQGRTDVAVPAVLSEYAIVYREKTYGQFHQIQNTNRDKQGNPTSAYLEYKFTQTGDPKDPRKTADVNPLGIVKVNDQGEIVQIISVNTPYISHAAFVAMCIKKGWKII
jgi:hypothetical protein